MGIHREPKNVQDVGGEAAQGLRRRIWWTLFVSRSILRAMHSLIELQSRERLTAFCQGRPCTIDPNDCTVREPSVDDFPISDRSRADVFIHWVRLCAIIGRVGQYLSRHTEQDLFPMHLAQELIDWTGALPEHLTLPQNSHRVRRYNRDAFKLHLPYLTTITVLHLNRSSQQSPQSLPEAYTTAVLSASCVACVIKDLFARGDVRFLGAIACWYVGVAIIALSQTQRIERLAESGAEDIRALKVALYELASLWPSAAVFVRGFERMKVFDNLGGAGSGHDRRHMTVRESPLQETSSTLSDVNWMHGIDWQSYFPNVTTQMSGLAAILLTEHQNELWGDISWLEDPTVQLQNLYHSTDMFSFPNATNLPSL